MKRRIDSNNSEVFETLSEEDRCTLSAYMQDVSRHIALTHKDKRLLETDFKKAITYCLSTGMTLEKALSLLPPSKLGGFYVHPPMRWFSLDDAAKIYPLSMQYGKMVVFRLSIYLKYDVVPELLQIALAFTIKRFPSFATTVKKGFFWHYLDTTKRRFVIEPESGTPCKALRIHQSGSQSFRVIYYKNKISAEFFHGLTDGNGGLVFLKTLAAEYLRLLGHVITAGEGVLDVNDFPSDLELANDFRKVCVERKKSGFLIAKATQMSGSLSRVKPCQVLHFDINTAELKSVCRQKNVTVTSYMLAMMFLACKSATEESSGCIQIQVPVNMRKFTESETIRNFTMYCCISIPLENVTSFDSVLTNVSTQLQQKTSQLEMENMMSNTVSLVKSVKMAPLFIKTPVAKTVYGFLGDNAFTSTLSNLGVVALPNDMTPYVEKFDFVLGGSAVSRASCAMVTFQDSAVFSITKSTMDPCFEEALCRLFETAGLTPKVTGSVPYDS